MDNKITKKRLSNFLAYEWILIIVISVLAVFCWEVVYSLASVRISTGQAFDYYYDTTVDSTNDTAFKNLFGFEKDGNVFSYDLLEFRSEKLSSDFNVLAMRLGSHIGDAIITSTTVKEDAPEGTVSNAQNIINNHPVYTVDQLLADAETYLKKFLKDGVSGADAHLVADNLDNQKMEDNFKRLSGDNRTRAGLITKADEVKRIKDLCNEVKDFKYLTENCDIFYTAKVPVKEGEQDIGATARYGLAPEKLTGGQKSASTFFRAVENASGTAQGTAVLVFNFTDYQPDMQFESITFLNTIVRNCSNLLG